MQRWNQESILFYNLFFFFLGLRSFFQISKAKYTSLFLLAMKYYLTNFSHLEMRIPLISYTFLVYMSLRAVKTISVAPDLFYQLSSRLSVYESDCLLVPCPIMTEKFPLMILNFSIFLLFAHTYVVMYTFHIFHAQFLYVGETTAPTKLLCLKVNDPRSSVFIHCVISQPFFLLGSFEIRCPY